MTTIGMTDLVDYTIVKRLADAYTNKYSEESVRHDFETTDAELLKYNLTDKQQAKRAKIREQSKRQLLRMDVFALQSLLHDVVRGQVNEDVS